MLMPLSRTSHAAWCDACLRGSEVITFPGALVARFVAIEELRAQGWVHEADAALQNSTREDAERAWTGATYCVECSTSARMRPPARTGDGVRAVEAPRRSAHRAHAQRA